MLCNLCKEFFFLQAECSHEGQGWWKRKVSFSGTSAELSWAFSQRPPLAVKQTIQIHKQLWAALRKDYLGMLQILFILASSPYRFTLCCRPTLLSLEHYFLGKKQKNKQLSKPSSRNLQLSSKSGWEGIREMQAIRILDHMKQAQVQCEVGWTALQWWDRFHLFNTWPPGESSALSHWAGGSAAPQTMRPLASQEDPSRSSAPRQLRCRRVGSCQTVLPECGVKNAYSLYWAE